LDRHRLISPSDIRFISIVRPFSSFNYIEDNFGGLDALRRLFSLARSSDATTLVVETIAAAGMIESENSALKNAYPDYASGGIVRLSFWTVEIKDTATLSRMTSNELLGYGILKQDLVPALKRRRWHVFEAVFKKYPHVHNCVPRPHTYSLTIGAGRFKIEGVLYCQQNALNKACAHVALRSLLTRLLPAGDVSYEEMNTIAERHKVPGWKPSEGLSVAQIRGILDHFRIGYRDIDYSQSPGLIDTMPYQKYAYAGIESGTGALVGFDLSGPALSNIGSHIIPFYGHTFNQDTWAPDADVAYFQIGANVGYVPSESWTSSFLGHDDNFGPNFCIPRLYIKPGQVKYVVELLRPNVQFGGATAEALALDFLYSVIPNISPLKNRWLGRLREWTNRQQIVMRAQSVIREEYITHLSALQDWEGNNEKAALCASLLERLPPVLWMVEISTPQLFPANERKLGEIILDAGKSLNGADGFNPYDVFIHARFPEYYFFGRDIDAEGKPRFLSIQSALLSHTSLYRV